MSKMGNISESTYRMKSASKTLLSPLHPKVLMVITDFAPGGAERQLVLLATRLAARGWPLKVVSLMPPAPTAKDWLKALERAGVEVLSLDIRRKWQFLQAWWRLRRVIRAEQPQIVHAFMVHANLLSRFVRPFSEVPVVICSIRSIHEGGRLREIIYRTTDPFCTLTTHVSREGVERYIHIGAVPPHKICYLPNGIDVKRFVLSPELRWQTRQMFGIKRSVFLWLAVGRLAPPKDYENLLQAFAHLAPHEPSVRLFIAGEGSLREDLESLSRRLNLTGKVKFLGLRQDIPQLMQAADAFVLSSAWEGMPNVLLEAAASGLPIVSTRVSGASPIVLEGKSGYLVPPKNPQALATAMLRLMRLSPEQRRRMGVQGRRHVQDHFDLECIVDRWEGLYHALLNGKDFTNFCETL